MLLLEQCIATTSYCMFNFRAAEIRKLGRIDCFGKVLLAVETNPWHLEV